IRHPIETLEVALSAAEVLEAAGAVREVYVSEPVKRYIVELTSRTRSSTDVYLGASPRGSLALFRAGQAKAALQGRHYVIPDDVKAMALPVLSHRLIIDPAARLRELSAERVVQEVLLTVPVPGSDFEPPAPASQA
ncbi:MAG: MoxR family ATPase, partial [Chloroflexota bacterium]